MYSMMTNHPISPLCVSGAESLSTKHQTSPSLYNPTLQILDTLDPAMSVPVKT